MSDAEFESLENVLDNPDEANNEKINAMNTYIDNRTYLSNNEKKQCKKLFGILADIDISRNGRIGTLNHQGTDAPVVMIEILTDIENNGYEHHEIFYILLDHINEYTNTRDNLPNYQKGGKYRKSRKTKKNKMKKTKKRRKTKRSKKNQ